MTRRRFLLGAAGIGVAAALAEVWPDEGLWNSCAPRPLVQDPAAAALVRAAFAGLDATQIRDVHVHLFGPGGPGSRVWVNPALRSILHPFEFAHARFYANAACLQDEGAQADDAYTARLAALLDDFAPGSRLLLLAMDAFHDESGRPVPGRTLFRIPDAYAAEVAARRPERFGWIASIHPHRPDCTAALDWAIAHGARGIKWIPSAMGVDPASARCDPFYGALARSGLPLLSHGGYEHPLLGSGALQEFNNPLALRRALESGIRVIVSHCASSGTGIDTDRGAHAPESPNFALFTRMMDEPRYVGRLFGDIAAITESSRAGPVLRTVLQRPDWQDRLLNGSDYPLPGYMPGVSLPRLSGAGFITAEQGRVLRRIREFNPLLFDFVLKRHLNADGARFGPLVFETARVFAPVATGTAHGPQQQRRAAPVGAA